MIPSELFLDIGAVGALSDPSPRRNPAGSRVETRRDQRKMVQRRVAKEGATL